MTLNIIPISKGELPSRRTYHASDRIRQYMLIYGGMDLNDKDDLWAFNMDENNWKQLKIRGPHPPRKFHSLTAIGDFLYIFGGCV